LALPAFNEGVAVHVASQYLLAKERLAIFGRLINLALDSGLAFAFALR
jgi:hypothetical protein